MTRPDDNLPDENLIAKAVALLRSGAPVALPTETVYGLAADASSPEAVAQIYRIKGRPDFNPLIVHVATLERARAIAHFDQRAEILAAHYWPGPLTLVLPLREHADIAPAVTAGLATIALRIPAHPLMQAVLQQSGLALAAPSANKSGRISPSCAQHVVRSLGADAPLVLDGGPCQAGLESSIIALRDGGWQMLRPGPVDQDAIAALLGEPPMALTHKAIEAPGQLASHYAPDKPLRLNVREAGADEWHIGFGAIAGDDNLSANGDLAEAAARLYAALHRAEQSEKAAIAVAPLPDCAMGAALHDRLRRAAAPRGGSSADS